MSFIRPHFSFARYNAPGTPRHAPLKANQARFRLTADLFLRNIVVSHGWGAIHVTKHFSLSALALMFCIGTAHAGIALSSNNSSIYIDTTNPAGLSNWTVDGNAIPAMHNYWLRFSPASAEVPVYSLGAPAEISLGDFGQVTYAGGGYTVTITFLLTGGSSGSNVSNLTEIVSVHKSAGLSGFSLFQYGSFNLSGGSGSNMVYFTGSNLAKQTAMLGTNNLSTAVTPIPNNFDATVSPALMNSLSDALPTVLGNNTTAGPGNTEWAFQWNAPGGTDFIMSKNTQIIVPEPGTALLLTLAAGLLIRKRPTR